MRRTKHLLPIVKRVIAKRLGTVNFIALDKKGNIASAVTTSGWGYKYPGRVGDSPIIGAGNYCDTKAGGACCTGFGELAMRNVTAKTAVDRLASGLSPAAVARRAIADANALATRHSTSSSSAPTERTPRPRIARTAGTRSWTSR